MPDSETMARARKDKREGKSPTTQAGEFVREEIHHIREGKHGAFDQASHRHRPIESTASWRRFAATGKGQDYRANS